MLFCRKGLAYLVPTLLLLLTFPKVLLADYVVTLKNGRKMTVYSYRGEGAQTRLFTPEGEIALPKEQILEIKKTEASLAPSPQKRADESPPPEPNKSQVEPARISPLYVPEEKPPDAGQGEPQRKKPEPG